MTHRQTESHRSSIRVGELLTRLQKFALGELENKYGEPIEFSKEQIKASEVLLNKALPSLAVTENINHEAPPTIDQIKERLNSLVMANPELIEQLVKYQAEQAATSMAIDGGRDALPDKRQEAPLSDKDEPDGQ